MSRFVPELRGESRQATRATRQNDRVDPTGDLGEPRDAGATRAPLDPAVAALLAAALDGDNRGRAIIATALRQDDADGRLLDHVAIAASAGSAQALELLLGAVDELAITRAPIRRLLVDPDAVDDVAQDVLIAVAERIGSFRGDARFTTWLFQVARFKTIDHLRRQRQSASLDEAEQELSDGERISSMIAARTTISAAIDELPEHYRQAVLLRDFERLPYAEIADRVDIPVNTAKTRVARGRALLAGRLERLRP